MSLLAVFATIALALAAIGIYGLMSYTVNQRTHEIGIRMALGAKRGEILHLVVRHGMILAIVGVVLGTVGALLLTRFLSSMLYGSVLTRSEEHTSELQSLAYLVCRLLLEKKKKKIKYYHTE